jgi:hypothetical protein
MMILRISVPFAQPNAANPVQVTSSQATSDRRLLTQLSLYGEQWGGLADNDQTREHSIAAESNLNDKRNCSGQFPRRRFFNNALFVDRGNIAQTHPTGLNARRSLSLRM